MFEQDVCLCEPKERRVTFKMCSFHDESLNTPLIAVIWNVFYGIERKSGGGSVQNPG